MRISGAFPQNVFISVDEFVSPTPQRCIHEKALFGFYSFIVGYNRL
jgi:hypothetical protein